MQAEGTGNWKKRKQEKRKEAARVYRENKIYKWQMETKGVKKNERWKQEDKGKERRREDRATEKKDACEKTKEREGEGRDRKMQEEV